MNNMKNKRQIQRECEVFASISALALIVAIALMAYTHVN